MIWLTRVKGACAGVRAVCRPAMPGALRKLDAVALEQAKRPRVQDTEDRN